MTVAEFFSMGGYGFYVWASLGMTVFIIVAEVTYLKRQRTTNIQRIRRLTKANRGLNK